MKKIIGLLLIIFAFQFSLSQIKEPVKWSTKIEKLSGLEFNLILTAKIEKDWHVYSQFTPDGGPLPMVLTFKDAKGNYELLGKAKESPYKKQFNEVFEVNEYYFANNFTITQKVKVINAKTRKLNLNLEYQVCKDVCINESKDFVFDISDIKPDEITTTQEQPTTVLDTQNIDSTKTAEVVSPSKNTTSQSSFSEKPVEESKSFWTIFFLAFLGGLTALLTPCVFPMIPLTVSFFTKQSGSRQKGIFNAVIYGLSIIFIYVFLGLLINWIFGPEALNALSTSVSFNIIFFIILVFFAISFLGGFEITLPQSWANKVDQQAGKSGIIAIFFMALALAIVSFSCTGPIVGTLLVQSASQGGIAPIIGMLGFSSAIALPFMLFALFPGWLNSLPKSGGWMNTVKASLGFLELALAFKFLSNADLVMQSHYLEREVFIAIWIAVFGAWALYLLGKISLSYYGADSNISVPRLLLALLVATFTVYMIPGLFGAPLKLISAFPPPISYSESPMGFGGSTVQNTTKELPEGAKFGEHNIITFEDYDKGLAYAKKVNKPVMLDFTGYACVNCRKMEINVWSDPSVKKILNDDVVLISLYVDDKRELPKEEQFISKSSGKEIVTIGNKWTDFIVSKYKTNTQPFYVLTDLEGNNLTNPISYTPNIKEYEKWLKTGIANFK